MARLINYFELKQRILEERSQIPTERNVHNDAMRCGIRKALRCLEQCQSVTDMVEVVRCKDCKHWVEADTGSWQTIGRTDGACRLLVDIHHAERYMTEGEHSCSYGERRTDEQQ